MKFLLDTHALIWALEDDARLGDALRDAITDPENQVLVSIVSLWEIAVKARIGKLRGDVETIARAATNAGFTLLGISVPHLATLRALPAHHNDPFVHLLIAQAVTEDAVLVSDDRRIRDYGVEIRGCRER